MKQTTTHPLMACAILTGIFLVGGCADPADNVHQSSAGAPREASVQSSAGSTFVIRTAKSSIGFVGSKVTGSHEGGFKKFEGKLEVADGKVVGAPEIKIDMRSTWSDNDRLTGHLKSADFFEVEKYPTSTFRVTSIEREGTQYKVTGNLELHGVTKSVSFPAEIQFGDQSVAVKAEFAINRKDFNINYPGRSNDLIRDNVVIKLDLHATPGAPGVEDQIGG